MAAWCGAAAAAPPLPAAPLGPYDEPLSRCFRNIHSAAPGLALSAADEVLRDKGAPVVARIRAHACRAQVHAVGGAPNEARTDIDALLPLLDTPGLGADERFRALSLSANVLGGIGEWQAAIPLHTRAAEHAHELGNASAQLEMLGAIAALQTTWADDPQAAYATLQQSLALAAASRLDAPPQLYYNLGYTLLSLGRPDEALAAFDRALAIEPPPGTLPPGVIEGLRARVQTHRGVVFRGRGELAQARQLFETSLDMQLRHGDVQGRAVTLMHLGALDFDQGRRTEALARVQEALALAERGNFAREQQAALRVLARLHAELGNSADALAMAERAHAIETGILRGQNLRGLAGLQLDVAQDIDATKTARSGQLSLFVIGALALVAVFGLGIAWFQLRLNRRLRHSVRTDALTGLLTRRELETRCDAGLFDGATPAVLMLIDLDDFKRINDRFGHDQGDEALRAAAQRMRDIVPAGALLARWGGEEFVLALPQGDAQAAATLAEQLRVAFARAPLRLARGHEAAVTLSLGWVAVPPHGQESAASWRVWLRLADQAAYAAKDAGRDRVVGVVLTADGAVLPPDLLADLPRAEAAGWIALHAAPAGAA